MNELYVIEMNWWQLSLFVMIIALYGAFLAEFAPRLLKRLADKLGVEKDE